MSDIEKLKRVLRREDVERLRQLWDEGITSGPGRFSGISDLKAEARRRLKAARGGKKSGRRG
jgi:antitoxin ParD1/3/4